MAEFTRELEVIREVQCSAQAHLEALGMSEAMLEPAPDRYQAAGVKYLLTRGGELLDTATITRQDDDIFVRTPDREYRHLMSAHPNYTSLYLTLGELARQRPENILLGMNYEGPDVAGNTLAVQRGTAHLYIDDRTNQVQRVALLAMRPLDQLEESSKGLFDNEDVLIQNTFLLVPTRYTASLAALITKDPEIIRKMYEEDVTLKLAEGLEHALPELSKRSRLSRYLLYQLEPDSQLYENGLAIDQIHSLLAEGATPIDFDELSASIEKTVGRSMALLNS